MQWFARGRLWASREAERDDFQLHKRAAAGPRDRQADSPEGAERRGSDWRPGGAHKDPRDRFKKKNRPERAWSEKDPATQRDRSDVARGFSRAEPRERKPSSGEKRPWSGEKRPWTPKPPSGERKPWQNKPAGGPPRNNDRPWQTKPTGPRAERKPWSPKPPDKSDLARGFSRAEPRERQPSSGEKRPWSGDKRPWTGKPPDKSDVARGFSRAEPRVRKPWSGKPRGPQGGTPADGTPRKRRDDDPDRD